MARGRVPCTRGTCFRCQRQDLIAGCWQVHQVLPHWNGGELQWDDDEICSQEAALPNGRTCLAALDHNFNVGRKQATIKRQTSTSAPVGTPRYKVVCQNFKKAWVAKAIYEKKSFSFVIDLISDSVMRKLTIDHYW